MVMGVGAVHRGPFTEWALSGLERAHKKVKPTHDTRRRNDRLRGARTTHVALRYHRFGTIGEGLLNQESDTSVGIQQPVDP